MPPCSSNGHWGLGTGAGFWDSNRLIRSPPVEVVQLSVPVAVVKTAFGLEKGELSDVEPWLRKIGWLVILSLVPPPPWRVILILVPPQQQSRRKEQKSRMNKGRNGALFASSFDFPLPHKQKGTNSKKDTPLMGVS